MARYMPAYEGDEWSPDELEQDRLAAEMLQRREPRMLDEPVEEVPVEEVPNEVDMPVRRGPPPSYVDPQSQLSSDLLREMLGGGREFPSNMPVITPRERGIDVEGIEGRRQGYYLEDVAQKMWGVPPPARPGERIGDTIDQYGPQMAQAQADDASSLLAPRRKGPSAQELEEFNKRYDPSKVPSMDDRLRELRAVEASKGQSPSSDYYIGGEADPQYGDDMQRWREENAVKAPSAQSFKITPEEALRRQIEKPYTTPELRGGNIEDYGQPLGQPGFRPQTTAEDLDFAFQQEDYMAGGRRGEDLDEWPETSEEFKLRYGREPATDAEVEYYMGQEDPESDPNQPVDIEQLLEQKRRQEEEEVERYKQFRRQ